MSVPYYGDFAEDDTVNIPFNTFTSNDPAASSTITDLADADIKVHKDGHVDQIVTDGATVVINFDSITGNHLITIDTSVDAAYATGSEYTVRIEGTTVDGATINAWIGAFSIERAGGVIALLKLIQTAVITNAAGADVATDIKAVKAETVLIVADTNELQGDDYPTSIAAIKAETALIVADTNELQADDYPTSIAAVQTTVDAIEVGTITNAAGADVATDIKAVKAETVLIVADTNELQGDDIPTKIAALPTAVEIQTEMEANGASILDTLRDDLADGGRLDLLVDAIKAKTDNLPADPADDSDIDTQLAAIKAETALIVADTNELQTDDYPTSIAAIKAETALIVADTNELQTDDIPGTLTTILAKLLAYVRLMTRSDAAVETDAATELTAINADEGAGAGNFSSQTDSEEAIADSGGGGPTAVQIREEMDSNSTQLSAIVTDTNELQGDDIPGTLSTIDGKIDTLDTVADGIQTDLSNGTDGLGALKALIDTLDTVADAVKAVTDNLPDSGALNDLAAILTDTGTTIPGLIAAVDTVVDAIYSALLTTHAEVGSIPSASASTLDKLELLFMALRNKFTSTASEQNICNDAGSSIGSNTVSDDATTLTKGEFS